MLLYLHLLKTTNNNSDIIFYLENNLINTINLKDKDNDPFKDNFNILNDYCYNINQLIRFFKEIEELINTEIYLSSWDKQNKISIRQFELNTLNG